MSRQAKAQNKAGAGVYLKKYWQLYVMLFLPLLYLLIFKYAPMIYVQIAFKKYSLVESVWKLPLAANHGFEYFIKAFGNNDFRYALRNTLTLNLLDLVFGFPAPIIFALILNELCFQRYKKVVQTIAYMPHFLSWVIIYSLALQLLAPNDGLVNMVLMKMGGSSIPFLNDAAHWIGSYIGFGIWQNFGWGSIVYLASIAGINPELYEAAAVDGAGRFRKMWHITLPAIKSTVIIMLILRVGSILNTGYEQIFLMRNDLNVAYAEVFDTFIYTRGIQNAQYSFSTAAGMFKSIVGMIMVLGANWTAKKAGESGIY